ncbi:MAG: hypothetical protein WCR46_15160 [Deltaproteobacteria bacterium]
MINDPSFRGGSSSIRITVGFSSLRAKKKRYTIRILTVGIKNLKTALNEFVEIGKAIEHGKPVKKEKSVYFTGFEAFMKAITPKGLALLHAIKTEKPSHVRRLSEIAERDVSTEKASTAHGKTNCFLTK